LTCRVTQSPVVSMAWAAWAWVASASSSRGGVESAATKMMSQRPRRMRTWASGQRAQGGIGAGDGNADDDADDVDDEADDDADGNADDDADGDADEDSGEGESSGMSCVVMPMGEVSGVRI
jgi:hypothetical protein